jgi:hypothetical protein
MLIRNRVFWAAGMLMLAMGIGGCRPARAPGTPIATSTQIVAASAATVEVTAAATTVPTSASTPAPAAILPTATRAATATAADSAGALALLLPTVTPAPATRPVSLTALPAPWQPAALERGAPEAALAIEALLPSGRSAQATIFAVAASGLDLHAYLRGVESEVVEQNAPNGIPTLLDARLDDTLAGDGTPVARLDFTLTPAQGEPLAIIQIAHLDGDRFVVVTVSAPESAHAELEVALRALVTLIMQGG